MEAQVDGESSIQARLPWPFRSRFSGIRTFLVGKSGIVCSEALMQLQLRLLAVGVAAASSAAVDAVGAPPRPNGA